MNSFWRVFLGGLAFLLALESIVLSVAWAIGMFPKTGEELFRVLLFGLLIFVLVGGAWALFPRKKAIK